MTIHESGSQKCSSSLQSSSLSSSPPCVTSPTGVTTLRRRGVLVVTCGGSSSPLRRRSERSRRSATARDVDERATTSASALSANAHAASVCISSIIRSHRARAADSFSSLVPLFSQTSTTGHDDVRLGAVGNGAQRSLRCFVSMRPAPALSIFFCGLPVVSSWAFSWSPCPSLSGLAVEGARLAARALVACSVVQRSRHRRRRRPQPLLSSDLLPRRQQSFVARRAGPAHRCRSPPPVRSVALRQGSRIHGLVSVATSGQRRQSRWHGFRRHRWASTAAASSRPRRRLLLRRRHRVEGVASAVHRRVFLAEVRWLRRRLPRLLRILRLLRCHCAGRAVDSVRCRRDAV